MQNDEQAIRQLVATWLSASKAGDSEKVLSLMADDVVFLVPGQPPMRGKSAFAAGQSGVKQFDFDATSACRSVATAESEFTTSSGASVPICNCLRLSSVS